MLNFSFIFEYWGVGLCNRKVILLPQQGNVQKGHKFKDNFKCNIKTVKLYLKAILKIQQFAIKF